MGIVKMLSSGSPGRNWYVSDVISFRFAVVERGEEKQIARNESGQPLAEGQMVSVQEVMGGALITAATSVDQVEALEATISK